MFISLSSKIRSFIKNPKGVAVVEISLAFVPYVFLIAAIWGIGRLAMTQAYFEVAMQEATRKIQPNLNARADWNMPDDITKITKADEDAYQQKLYEQIKAELPNMIGYYYNYYSGANSPDGYLGFLAIRLGAKDIHIQETNIDPNSKVSVLSSGCRLQPDKFLDKVGTCSFIVAVKVNVNYKWVLPIPMLLGQKPDELISRTIVLYQERKI